MRCNQFLRALEPVVRAVIEPHHEIAPSAPGDVVCETGDTIKTANIGHKGFFVHVLRHSADVFMAQADVPMQKIAQFLGHMSSRETETTYAQYAMVPEGCSRCAQFMTLGGTLIPPEPLGEII